LHPKNDVAVTKTHATGVTRIQSVVLHRIGGRGHFRSRDVDGGIGGQTQTLNKLLHILRQEPHQEMR